MNRSHPRARSALLASLVAAALLAGGFVDAAARERWQGAAGLLDYANGTETRAVRGEPDCECVLLLGMFNTSANAAQYKERGVVCPFTLKPYDRVLAFGSDGKLVEVVRVVGDNLVRSPLSRYDEVKHIETRYLVSHSNGNDVLINAAKLGLRVREDVLALAPPRGFDGGAHHIDARRVVIRRQEQDPVPNVTGKGLIPFVTTLQKWFDWSLEPGRASDENKSAREGLELRGRFGAGGPKPQLDIGNWRNRESVDPGRSGAAGQSIFAPYPVQGRAYFTDEQFGDLVARFPRAEGVLKPHVRRLQDRLSVDDLYIETNQLSDADRKVLGSAAMGALTRRIPGVHQYRTNVQNYLYEEMSRLSDEVTAASRQIAPAQAVQAGADIDAKAARLRQLAAFAPEVARQAAPRIETATAAVQRAVERGELKLPKSYAMPGFGPSTPTTSPPQVAPVARNGPDSRPIGGIELKSTKVAAPVGPSGIAGLVIDPASKRIVLLSEDGARTDPGIAAKDLALGLWLAYTGQNAAFSLDAADPKNPAGKWLKAVYFPEAIRGLSASQELFIADFLLKQYALGVRIEGNRIVERITATALKSVPKLMDEGAPGGASQQWARFWIVPESVELDAAGGVARVAAVKMAVRARRQVPDPSSRTGLRDVETDDDSVEARFARQFSELYETLGAVEAPELNRVRDLAVAAAFGRWLKDQGVRVDMDQVVALLNRDRFEAVDKVTALSATWQSEKREPFSNANGAGVRTTTRQIRLFGGVDLAVTPRVTQERSVAALREATVTKLALGGSNTVFAVRYAGQVYQGEVMPFGIVTVGGAEFGGAKQAETGRKRER